MLSRSRCFRATEKSTRPVNGHLTLGKKATSTATIGLSDKIPQNVLKECQLSVCRCFPSEFSPRRFFSKFIGSNHALSGWYG
jgi:hypothetical protein